MASAAARTFHTTPLQRSQYPSTPPNSSSPLQPRRLSFSSLDTLNFPSIPTTFTAPAATQGKKIKLFHDHGVYAPAVSFPTAAQLYRETPQRITHNYKSEANFASVLFVMIRRDWFDESAWYGASDAANDISTIHPDFAALITHVPRLRRIDFSVLRHPRTNYATQERICRQRIWLLAACAVHYNLDFGLVTRYLGGEYTATHRDAHAIINQVRGLISNEDLSHIERIITVGCPSYFNYEESDKNKEVFLKRARSVTLPIDIVEKTLNKEERNSHIIPFPSFLVRASTTAHHVPQALIQKEGKKDRLVWDGSTKRSHDDIVMNELTPTDLEAMITFGAMYMAYLTWIWNLRITFPDVDIFLGFIDISSCFRWPRIFPCLVGAFGFIIGSIFYAANAMVFGSVASASSWEPFRRAIAALASSYGRDDNILAKHMDMLQQINIHSPTIDGPDTQGITPATPCTINKGVAKGPDKKLISTPHFIYVDDDLIADTAPRLPYTLANIIHAIYSVMGWPEPLVRPTPVAEDKWLLLHLRTRQVLLGLVFDTRKMTVEISDEFRAEALSLLRSSWHKNRVSFTVHEIEILIGKLARLGQAFRPIYHLMPHLYASVAYALNQNKSFLVSTSKQFRSIIQTIKKLRDTSDDKNDSAISFSLKRSAQLIHRSKQKYRIPVSLREEIDYITELLSDDTISLSVPIAHLVPRSPQFTAAADSCKKGGGGWSLDLKFWWHLPYPETVITRAYLKNNKSGLLVSINVLELVCVIVNMAASIFACYFDNEDLSSCPVLLNWCDNTAACSWVSYRCKNSLIGRRLARLLVGLLMGTKLGIQAEWLSTIDNSLADEISRITKPINKNYFDYESFLSTHPSLSNCRIFQPSQVLLGMIWDVLLNESSPDPLTVRTLKPQDLGSFISSTSLRNTT